MAKRRRNESSYYPLIYSTLSSLYRRGATLGQALANIVHAGYRHLQSLAQSIWPTVVRREDIMRELAETPRGRFISLTRMAGCYGDKNNVYASVTVRYTDPDTGETRRTGTTVDLSGVRTVAQLEQRVLDMARDSVIRDLRVRGTDVNMNIIIGNRIGEDVRINYIDCR